MRMITRIFYFGILSLWLMSAQLVGQTQTSSFYQLQGIVQDETGRPIEVGNLLLLSPKDSSLITGMLFQEGVFEIAGIRPTSFLLKISALGYADHYQSIVNKTHDPVIDLGTIYLGLHLMEGVEVVARQPLFTERGENVVVNVSQTSLNSVGTAMDVLRLSPKVFINSGNQISVIGKGAALVYIDGQLTPSNQVLGVLSSADIKEIEIIENPAAKYDAAGNAVINIITKNRTIEGYKIGLVQELEQRTYFRSYFKANAYVRLSKWMLQASYGIRPFRHLGQEYYARTYDFDQASIHIDNRFDYTLNILGHDYSFKTTYQLSPIAELGIQYQGQARDGDKDATNRNQYRENGLPGFTLNSTVTGPYRQQNNTLSFYYDQKLDTLGSNLRLTGQYANFVLNRLEYIDQQLSQDGSLSAINWRTYNTNAIDISSFQLDYQKVLVNGMQVGAGAKNAYIANQSRLDFSDLRDNGEYQLVGAASSDYDYDENILAAYTELSGQVGPWSYKMGLRAEWTKTNGIAGADEGGISISKNYLNVFPSASISRNLAEDWTFNAAYNYRVQRPRFQDLNPFVLYVDSLASLRGNPDLVPAYTHSLASTIKYKSFGLNLNYSHIQDRISTLIEVTDPERPAAFSFIRDNIEYATLYAASLTLPFQYKWWNSYNVIGTRFEAHHLLDNEVMTINQQAGYYLFTQQTFQLPADFKLTVNYQYTSPRVDGIYLDNPISNFGFTLSRKFFHQQLTVNMVANDIFNKYRFTGISTFDNTLLNYLSAGDMRSFRLALHWDFGKLGTNVLDEKKISKAELNRL